MLNRLLSDAVFPWPRRSVAYRVPDVFRRYERQFPRRVARFLRRGSPDRYNDDALNGEIRAVLLAGKQDLERQYRRNQESLRDKRRRDAARLVAVNEQIDQTDRQIRDIDRLLESL